LIPDFQGNEVALRTVLAAKPDILNHNIETIERLYSTVRPQANYKQSLWLLGLASKTGATTKSGIMVGLGETIEEVIVVLADLRKAGCTIATIGQYLQPSGQHIPVKEYVRPEVFEQLKVQALSMGFASVFSGPFVRSSYRAEEVFNVSNR
jgi:lipoic acid synthetase